MIVSLYQLGELPRKFDCKAPAIVWTMDQLSLFIGGRLKAERPILVKIPDARTGFADFLEH